MHIDKLIKYTDGQIIPGLMVPTERDQSIDKFIKFDHILHRILKFLNSSKEKKNKRDNLSIEKNTITGNYLKPPRIIY